MIFTRLVPHDLIDDCRQRFLDIIDKKVEKGRSDKTAFLIK